MFLLQPCQCCPPAQQVITVNTSWLHAKKIYMKLCLCIILTVCLYSCVNTKKYSTVWIPGNQTIYEKQNASVGNANPTDVVIEKKLTKGAKAKVTIPILSTDI